MVRWNTTLLGIALAAAVLLAGCTGRQRQSGDDDDGRGDGDADADVDGDADADADADVDGDADTDADADGDACRGLTLQGECNGGQLRWCEDGQIWEADCLGLFPAPATGSCEWISTAYGYGCAVQPGDLCSYADGNGNPLTALCAGEQPGCVFRAEGGAVCRERVGVCLPVDVGACTADGSLILGCEGSGGDVDRIEGQPTVAPCGEWGGECELYACFDLDPGAQCVEDGPITLTCSDVYNCEDGRCATRRCADAPAGAGACANHADCAVIDEDPERMLGITLDCFGAGGNVQACIQAESGLSAGCSECFTHLDPDEFESCAGF